MTKQIQISKKRMQELATELSCLRLAFLNEGMYITSHAMHDVVREMGWEMADIINGNHPTKLADEVAEIVDDLREAVEDEPVGDPDTG